MQAWKTKAQKTLSLSLKEHLKCDTIVPYRICNLPQNLDNLPEKSKRSRSQKAIQREIAALKEKRPSSTGLRSAGSRALNIVERSFLYHSSLRAVVLIRGRHS